MDLPITVPVTTPKTWQPPRNRLLYWLIPAALLLGFFGVYLVAGLILWLLTPFNTAYPRDLLAMTSADYGVWESGPGLPALDPDAASAAEEDDLPPNGPVSTVPAAIVPQRDPSEPTDPTPSPEPSPTLEPSVAVPTETAPPSPTLEPSATPSPTPSPTVEPISEAVPATTSEEPVVDSGPGFEVPTAEPPTAEPPVVTVATDAPPTSPPAETSAPSTPRPTIGGQGPRPTDALRPTSPTVGGTPETNPIETPQPTARPETPQPTATATIPPATNTPVPPTPTATNTPVPPTATATATAVPINWPPIVNDDRVVVAEDDMAVIDVLGNDGDIDGNPLTIVGGTQPPNGSVALSGTLLVYRPDPDFNGADGFSYTISDGAATTAGNVALVVVPVNDAPRFTAGQNISVLENYNGNGVYTATWATNISAGPANERGQALAFGAAVLSNPGLFVVPPTLGRDGVMRFTLAEGASGTALLEVFLRDDGGTDNGGVDRSQPVVFNVLVQPVNDAPIAVADSISVPEDSSIAYNVLVNDADPDGKDDLDPSTVTISATKQISTSVDRSTGAVTFVPTKDYSGTVKLDYRVCDRGTPRLCATAPVTVTVVPVNDAPIAATDVITVVRGGGVSAIDVATLLANDSDVERDTITVTGVMQPMLAGSGANALLANGIVYYRQPTSGSATEDVFRYTISDGNAVATTTVTINIIEAFSTSSCANVEFKPSLVSSAPNVKHLRVEMYNRSGTAINAASIGPDLLYINIFEKNPKNISMVEPTSSDPVFAITADEAEIGRFYQLRGSSTSTAITTTFDLIYTHTTTVAATSDDSFRARFAVNGKQCTVAGQFPANQSETLPSTSSLQIEFKDPAGDGITITNEISASFRVEARERDAVENGTGVAFVAWRITTVNGEVVHAWNEYFRPYCAFSDDGPTENCFNPTKTRGPDWWAALPNGSYRIDVYARGTNGDSTPVISRTFVKAAPTR